MSRPVITAAILACLPLGATLELAAHGNAAAETVLVVGGITATASVGWYGPKTAIERHGARRPGPGRRRADGGTMAVRPRTTATEDIRPPREDAPAVEEQPAVEPQPAAESAGRPVVDPYLAGSDPTVVLDVDGDDTAVLDMTAVREQLATSDEELAKRGQWWVTTGSATSYDTPPGEDLYAHQDYEWTPTSAWPVAST